MPKISKSKQIEGLVRLLFHYLDLEFICFLGFVVCDFIFVFFRVFAGKCF